MSGYMSGVLSGKTGGGTFGSHTAGGSHPAVSSRQEAHASNSQDPVIRAIDGCLQKDRAGGIALAVSNGFSRFARHMDGRHRVGIEEATEMAAAISQELNLPFQLFDGMEQRYQCFDFNGDGFLDEHEIQKMFKRLLKAKRVELAGYRELDVPWSTVEREGYGVEKELGKGGQGTMYLCSKRGTRSQFCIKFYSKEDANAGGLEELIDEFNLMKEMRNPHIAKTYQVFQDKTFFYLVNEPYFGGDFTKLGKKALEAGVQMNEGWWRSLFQQVLVGLDYLHNNATIHCDIKEPNIMIADAQNFANPRPVLIDFGLAEAFSSSRRGVCGTPGYIPPETWENGIWYPRGDVFSLGVVFFQMLAGEMGVLCPTGPVSDTTEFQMMARECRLPWQVFPQEMPQLKDVIQGMVHPSMQRRLRTKQVLEHEWFSSRDNAQLSRNGLERIFGKAAARHAEEEIIAQLEKACSLDGIRSLQNKFASADQHGTGFVEMHAAVDMLAEHGVDRQAAERHVQAADAVGGGQGMYFYPDLIGEALSAKENYGANFLRELFDRLDLDSSGFLSLDELRQIVESGLIQCPNDEVEYLLLQMDKDRDGIVSFDEFTAAALAYGRIKRRSEVEYRSFTAQQGEMDVGGVTMEMRPPEFLPDGPRLLRVSVLGVSGFRDSEPSVVCSIAGRGRPCFETRVAGSRGYPGGAGGDREIPDYMPGEDLEFAVSSQAARYGGSAAAEGDGSIGYALLRSEQFFPYGFNAETTISCQLQGILGLLRVRVAVPDTPLSGVPGSGIASRGNTEPGYAGAARVGASRPPVLTTASYASSPAFPLASSPPFQAPSCTAGSSSFASRGAVRGSAVPAASLVSQPMSAEASSRVQRVDPPRSGFRSMTPTSALSRSRPPVAAGASLAPRSNFAAVSSSRRTAAFGAESLDTIGTMGVAVETLERRPVCGGAAPSVPLAVETLDRNRPSTMASRRMPAQHGATVGAPASLRPTIPTSTGRPAPAAVHTMASPLRGSVGSRHASGIGLPQFATVA